ncbi:MAG: DbpA RNA binding domain-containing protein, partial [Bifidobacteriaceae bacterium]|nr:DbpA RNA binding domain-containing protein [Bifidobacteriaceae bacterium]
ALAALAVRDAVPSGRAGEADSLDAELARLRDRDQAKARRGANGEGRWRGSERQNGEDRWRGSERPNGRKGRDPRQGGDPWGGRGPKRYWIGVGHGHGARPGAIVGAITGETRLSGADLGRIEMFRNFSLVEIGGDLNRDTMRQLARTRVAGRELRIRPDAGHDAR